MKNHIKTDLQSRLAIENGAKLRSLAASEGWKEAKQLLTEKLVELANVQNIPLQGDTMVEVRARQIVIDTFVSWLVEVEGTASQNRSTMEIMGDELRSSHLLHLEEEEQM